MSNWIAWLKRTCSLIPAMPRVSCVSASTVDTGHCVSARSCARKRLAMRKSECSSPQKTMTGLRELRRYWTASMEACRLPISRKRPAAAVLCSIAVFTRNIFAPLFRPEPCSLSRYWR
ncbi:UNVERIFIED_CONTAM: hypothetical protein GTU68_060839 [Idotea baltica]|nr:hypothetical protein [Idotea baltica]